MILKEVKKTEIKTQVETALKNFIRNKGLVKKEKRIISPFDLIKKYELAEQFIRKCNLKIICESEEENKLINDYIKIHLDRASSIIINEYL